MITLKEWMELVDYRITEGNDYCFAVYGDKAYSLDYWNGDHDGHGMSIVFDRDTQTVFEVQVCDYRNDRAYRLINPDYANQGQDKDAWDDVQWTDLEVDDDFMRKALSILNNEDDYDTRVSVPIDLPNDKLFELMKLAHERDITFNQLMEEVLRAAIDRHNHDLA